MGDVAVIGQAVEVVEMYTIESGSRIFNLHFNLRPILIFIVPFIFGLVESWDIFYDTTLPSRSLLRIEFPSAHRTRISTSVFG